MRVRLVAALLAVVLLGIVIAVVRFNRGKPENTVATATISPLPAATATMTPLPAETPSASPVPSASESTLAATSPGASVSPAAVAAAPMPTENPNLLTVTNGTIMRGWTIGTTGAPAAPALEHIDLIDPKFSKPIAFVFELRSTSHLARAGATIRSSAPATVRVALAMNPHAFHDAGTIAIPSNDATNEHAVDVNADARYVRFTLERPTGTNVLVGRLAAYGTAGPPERGSLAGAWISADNVEAAGDEMFGNVKGSIPDSLPAKDTNSPRLTRVQEGTLTEFYCDRYTPAWHGTIAGDVANGPPGDRLQLAGDGKLLVGVADSAAVVLMRSPRMPPACAETDKGSGPSVLALVRDGDQPEPEVDPSFVPGYRYHRAIPMLVDQSRLARAQIAVLDGECTVARDLLPAQQRLLLDWVAAGHKLIIRDSDMCSTSEYSFIPYPFTTVATGARGAKSQILSIADPSSLGAGATDRAHFFDAAAYLKAPFQQIGDADIMQTKDPHLVRPPLFPKLRRRNGLGARVRTVWARPHHLQRLRSR